MKLEILPIEKTEPAYILTIHYMIGDGDGDTETWVSFTELDEQLIKLIRILNKLDRYVPEGHWGFIFDGHHYKHALNDEILTEEEVNFLSLDDDVCDEFLCDIIRNSYCDDREFLVYQGFDITYRDENNCIHSVNIIDL